MHVDIVFDGPPGHESGRFVEVENENGQSIKFGEWIRRDDGYWVLRIRGMKAEEVQAKLAAAEQRDGEIERLKAEIDHIKTVEFPRRAENITKAKNAEIARLKGERGEG